MSLEDFLAWFQNLYGTEPQAVGLLVRVDAVEVEPPAETESLVAEAKGTLLAPVAEPHELASRVPEFVAKEPVSGEAYEYFAEPDQSSATASTGVTSMVPGGTPTTAAVSISSAAGGAIEMMPGGGRVAATVPTSVSWAPSYMEINVERYGTRQYFSQYAAWKFGANPAVRPQMLFCTSLNCNTIDWGMEFGIDVYNYSNPDYVRSPVSPCPNEMNFLATNESFTWGVSTGQTDLKQTTDAYADDWEIADNCRKNAFAVGLAKPWNIPTNASGFKQILVSINAPVGNQGLGRIGGTVTLNDDYACQVVPGVGRAQCMGDALIEPPDPYEAGRLTLKETRGWWANPNKCWASPNSGRSDPAKIIPHDFDGCY